MRRAGTCDPCGWFCIALKYQHDRGPPRIDACDTRANSFEACLEKPPKRRKQETRRLRTVTMYSTAGRRTKVIGRVSNVGMEMLVGLGAYFRLGVYSAEVHPFGLVHEYMDVHDVRQCLSNKPNMGRMKPVLVPSPLDHYPPMFSPTHMVCHPSTPHIRVTRFTFAGRQRRHCPRCRPWRCNYSPESDRTHTSHRGLRYVRLRGHGPGGA